MSHRDESGPTGARRIDRSELEADRTFLLRSLQDLDAERAVGNIDDVTYRVLHDDYTARAAAVLRSLTDNEDVRPVRAAPIGWSRRIAIGVLVVAFVGAAGWWLAGALGDRGSGQLASGNANAVDGKGRAKNFEAELAKNPDNAALHLAYAQFLAPTDSAAALKQYGLAAQLDPTNPEAPAYGGWLLYLKFKQVDAALQSVDKALQRDPAYPDAKFFKGMILFRGRGDASSAIPYFQDFLASSPDHPMADQVRSVLAQAVEASASSTAAPVVPPPGSTGSSVTASTTVP